MIFNIFRNEIKSRKQQKRDKRHAVLTLAVLVVVSTALVVWFLPRSASFNYEYSVGEPWRYGPVYANQKFNILMSDSDMQRQQDSVRSQFQPYFNVRPNVHAAMRDRLLHLSVRDADGHSHEASDIDSLRPCLAYVASLLDTIYERGLIAPATLDSLNDNGTQRIRIITDNVARSVSIHSVFSTHSAYRYIMQHRGSFRLGTLQQLNLNNVLEENLVYDGEKSRDELSGELSELSTGVGFVMANEKIVDRGEIVSADTYMKLRSYENVVSEQATEQGKLPFIWAGQVTLVLILMTLLATYLWLFRRDYLWKPSSVFLLYGLITTFSVLASLMMTYHFLHIFVLPCVMVPIIIRVFLDSRTAFIFHTAMVLLISLVLSYPYEFVLLQVVAGIAAIQNLRELSQRSQIVRTTFVITAISVLFYVAYELTLGLAPGELDRSEIIYLLISGVFLLFTYPLLWVFERAFGFISDVTLVELTNINSPLLQRMTEVAPGTFQHSMQVANLAADVAKRIGAKVQLVRTGALYHDIGKMERPVFFTENQNGISPHRHLTPLKSAEVIINHVTHGLQMAADAHLPQVIRRFIATHHGSGLVKYFYITYCNEHPDEDVDPAPFRYPGPNPESTEEAILMMCDSVEAASRSLPEYTGEAIDCLVDKIIDNQMADGFFQECDITFRQIAQAKAALKERLRNVYHTRISYPELQQNAESGAAAAAPKPADTPAPVAEDAADEAEEDDVAHIS